MTRRIRWGVLGCAGIAEKAVIPAIQSSRLGRVTAIASRDLKVVVYCKTSGRAALAACAMRDMGYLQVQSIAGGFDAWAAAGKPVASPEPPSFD